MTRLSLALVILLAVVLRLQCLGWGFMADDYVHQVVLEGHVESPTMKPWNLYDFGEIPGHDDPIFDSMGPPWWMGEGWKARFWRPLSSLSIALDHALWGANPVGYHVSGLLWLVVLMLLCYGLYRALGLTAPVAIGALLFFALDDGGYVPVGWIANRNTLMEAIFTVASLWALASSRRLGRGGAIGLCLLFASLALGSKESAIALLLLIPVYLFLGCPHAEWPRRWRTAATIAALLLAVAYLAFWVGSGYGVSSLFYPTPWGEPWQWLKRLAVMLPSAVLSLVFPAPVDLLLLKPALTPLFVLAGLLIAVFLGRVLWATLGKQRSTVFLLVWIPLTLIPRVGAPHSDRLLFVSSIASAALFAQLVAAAPRPLLQNLGSASARWAVFLILGAGVLSSGSLISSMRVFRQVSDESRAAVLDADVGDPAPGRRDVLFLQLPNSMVGLQPSAVWRNHREDPGVRFWSFQYGRRALRLTRTGERTLRIESLDQPFAVLPFEWVFRTRDTPLELGRSYPSTLFDTTVVEIDGAGVRTVELEFHKPLDDPRVRLLAWKDGRLRRILPPAIGEMMEVAAVVPPMPFWP